MKNPLRSPLDPDILNAIAQKKIQGFVVYVFDDEETHEVLFYAHSQLEAEGYATSWAWNSLDRKRDWEVRVKGVR